MVMPCVDDRDHGFGIVFGNVGRRKSRQGRQADRGSSGCKRYSASGCYADAQPRETAGASSDRNAVQA